jgi:hypothetical protein
MFYLYRKSDGAIISRHLEQEQSLIAPDANIGRVGSEMIIYPHDFPYWSVIKGKLVRGEPARTNQLRKEGHLERNASLSREFWSLVTSGTTVEDMRRALELLGNRIFPRT